LAAVTNGKITPDSRNGKTLGFREDRIDEIRTIINPAYTPPSHSAPLSALKPIVTLLDSVMAAH
jgi:hypothetical protein